MPLEARMSDEAQIAQLIALLTWAASVPDEAQTAQARAEASRIELRRQIEASTAMREASRTLVEQSAVVLAAARQTARRGL